MSVPPAPGGVEAGGFAGLPKGRLAENVLHFVRALRACGLPVGPAKMLDALAAVDAVGIDRREDFRAALAAILVSRREHLPLFEQAFELFWRNPRLLEKITAALLPQVRGRTDGGRAAEVAGAARRGAAAAAARRARPRRREEVELDAAFTFSPREVLQHKDFATMSTAELAEVKRLMARTAPAAARAADAAHARRAARAPRRPARDAAPR